MHVLAGQAVVHGYQQSLVVSAYHGRSSQGVTLHGQGSQAYAKALARAGVLTEEEAKTIVEGLGQVTALLHLPWY